MFLWKSAILRENVTFYEILTFSVILITSVAQIMHSESSLTCISSKIILHVKIENFPSSVELLNIQL